MMCIVPTESPQIDVGNFMVYQKFQTIFEHHPKRDVFIYWKEVHDQKFCWFNFFAYFATCTLSTNDDKSVKGIKTLLVLINCIMHLLIII